MGIKQFNNYQGTTIWGLQRKKFLSEHFGEYLPEDSYIRKKHWIEAKRYHSDPHYIPKWKNIPNTQTSLRSCIHPQCTDKFRDKLFKPSFTTINELEKLLGVQSSSFSVPKLLQQSLSTLQPNTHLLNLWSYTKAWSEISSTQSQSCNYFKMQVYM